jgi:hypothetical protein
MTFMERKKRFKMARSSSIVVHLDAHSGIYIYCTGTVVLLSHLSAARWETACTMYEDDFWIVGGFSGYIRDTVESFSFRYVEQWRAHFFQN